MVKSVQCTARMTFEECEMEILRHHVDIQHAQNLKRQANDETVKLILQTVEEFIRDKKRICYGGISINALLPTEDQIYNYDLEIPDYDFFSPDAINDVKALADLFAKKGFSEVEAKAGVHFRTYKLYVNFIGVADITQIHDEIYKQLRREAFVAHKILYCPPNFLRMLMYLELSRPYGNISRWEKVLKRLTLLNKHYPLKNNECNHTQPIVTVVVPKEIYDLTKAYLISKNVVFFGSFAISKYLDASESNQPNFDVLAENAQSVANGLHHLLKPKVNCRCKTQLSLGDIISTHYQILVGKELIATIYAPIACHSYNVLKLKPNMHIKIATIDTMFSFYLAFLYTNRKYYDKERILCMAQLLFEIQQKNRLKQKGLLKRFSMECYGKQETLIDIRNNKSKKFRQLRGKKMTSEYQEWFLRYRPKTKKQSKL